jgi:hypothetical protein
MQEPEVPPKQTAERQIQAATKLMPEPKVYDSRSASAFGATSGMSHPWSRDCKRHFPNSYFPRLSPEAINTRTGAGLLRSTRREWMEFLLDAGAVFLMTSDFFFTTLLLVEGASRHLMLRA